MSPVAGWPGAAEPPGAGPGAALRVGLDYRPARFGRGGIRVYAEHLARALAPALGPDLRLYAGAWRARGGPEPTPPPGARWVGGRVPGRALGWLSRLGWGVERRLGGVDLLHWTDYAALPARTARVVATLHDVLFLEMPEAYPRAMRRALLRHTRRALDAAAALIVPSPETAAALTAHFAVAPGRLHVVPHGVVVPAAGAAAVGAAGGGGAAGGDPFVLAVGTLEPRKNAERLVRAFAALPPPWRLLWAGARGWLDAPALRALGAAPRVRFLGAVDAATLERLYAGAAFVAYVSLGEGFGLPALEAMARGKALLVGAGTAPARLAGDAALAVDPRDVDALAAGLSRLAGDPALCARLGARGRVGAEPYTWERAARGTLAAYRAARA